MKPWLQVAFRPYKTSVPSLPSPPSPEITGALLSCSLHTPSYQPLGGPASALRRFFLHPHPQPSTSYPPITASSHSFHLDFFPRVILLHKPGGMVEFLHYLLFPSLFGCTAWHVGILVPRPGIEPTPPALEVQNLNHWATRLRLNSLKQELLRLV